MNMKPGTFEYNHYLVTHVLKEVMENGHKNLSPCRAFRVIRDAWTDCHVFHLAIDKFNEDSSRDTTYITLHIPHEDVSNLTALVDLVVKYLNFACQ